MGNRSLTCFLLRASLVPLWAASRAMAHHLPPGMEDVDEFATEPLAAALAHPLSGADHWLAALAVGFVTWSWGRKLGVQSILNFVMSLAAGIVAGRAGWHLPLMETGLAVSVILGGVVVAGTRWSSPKVVLGLSAIIGAWHGVAHGVEMPAGAPPGLYGLGLILTSGAIALVAGLLAAQLPAKHASLPRWAGGSLAAAGSYLLISSFAF